MPSLIRSSEDDLKKIASMARVIWMEYYGTFLPTDQLEYMLNKFYSHEAMLSQEANGQHFYNITDNGESIGFISLSTSDPENCFIHKFYIYESHRSQNLGSVIMKQIQALIERDRGYKNFSIRLTVNRQNFKAINFYFKNGFRIEKVEDFDISSGYYMNDFVMLYRH